MNDTLAPVVSIVQPARSIYIATHVTPDGDAIGSTLAMGWIMREMGKQWTVACADPVPPSLRFLPGSDLFVTEPPTGQDVIIVLDTGDLDRLGNIYIAEAYRERPVINIDHHVTNSHFGTVNIVDSQAAAVGEIIYALAQVLGVRLTTDIATCLLTAIVTDTLGFRIPSTTAHTLRIAAALMEAGASLTAVVQQTFESRPLPVLRIWGQVLSHFSVENGIAWASIPWVVLQQYGVKESEIRGLVNVMRGTEGVLVAVLIFETPEGNVKAEFRSNGNVNVADIATALGGGGHRGASGCLVPGPLSDAERQILEAVHKYISRHGRHSQPVEAAGNHIP